MMGAIDEGVYWTPDGAVYWVIGSGAVFRLKGPGEIGTDPLPCATLPRDAERVELDPDSAMTQAVILGESRT